MTLRTLTPAQLAEYAKTVTQPGYFLEFDFSVPVRFCTRGERSWNGQTWLAANCKIDGFGIDGTPIQEGAIEFVDFTRGDLALLCLAEGVADRPAFVWMFSGEGPADDDPVLLFDGVMDIYDIDTGSGAIKFPLRKSQVLMAPRQLMNAANGFHFPAAPGTKIHWAGQDYVLQPASR